MDEICQDDQWFEQAFTYMNKHDIPLPNDKKLHVRNTLSRLNFFLLTPNVVLWTF